MREWLSGRASPCQGERREFESRLPLQKIRTRKCADFFTYARYSYFHKIDMFFGKGKPLPYKTRYDINLVATRQHIVPSGISSAFAHIENLARDLYRRKKTLSFDKVFFLVEEDGFAFLRKSRSAALTCHRHVIHYRSPSNPLFFPS